MGSRYVLGLDAGGGGATALLLDLDSGATVTARRAWRHPPAPATGGWGADFDHRRAWRFFGEVTREVISRAGIESTAIAAIATTGMRHGLVVIGPDGEESWAAPNRDARAAGEATELAAEHGAEIYRRTGLWPAPMLPLAKLRWLRENEPGLVDGARAVLSISDWLTYRLSGEFVAEPTQASATGMLELAGGWADDLARLAGINSGLLPPLVRAGERVGEVSGAVADALGLAQGTPVFAGGADTQMALLASGATSAGDAAAVCGTTMALQQVVAEPIVDAAGRLWSGRLALEGSWVLESNAGAAGEALELVAGWLFPRDARGVGRLLALSATTAPGAGGLTSDIGVTVFNASALGLPVGALTLSPLALSGDVSARALVARAVVEGIAFSLRANLEQIEAVAGAGRAPLRLSGGLTRSKAWCQLVADVTGREVVRSHEPAASALGAAICAAAGLEGTAIRDMARKLTGEGEPFTPATGAVAVYRDLYETWTRHRSLRTSADEAAAEGILGAREDDVAAVVSAAFAPARHRPRVLVTAPMDGASLSRLRATADVTYEPFMESQRVLTEEDLVEALGGFDVLVTEVDVVDAASLAKLPRLRGVFTCRADPVNVDVPGCTAHGVAVMNAPGRNARSVAELTLAFILALTRKPFAADRFMRDPETTAGDIARMGMAHAEFEGKELSRMTVGLVGYGNVGREVAGALRPLAGRIIVADPFASETDALAEGVELVSLNALLAEADVVSLHAPVTEGTRAMIGADQFVEMRPGALLINTARAGLVDEDALVMALQSGRLGGAALDVFAIEPPGNDHPLLQLPNVIATPHIGGNTLDVARRQGEMVCQAIEDLVEGRAPATLLNPDVLRWFNWEGERKEPTAAELKALEGGRGPAVTDLEAEGSDGPSVSRAERRSAISRLRRALTPRPPLPLPGRRGDERSAALGPTTIVAPTTASSNGRAYWETLFGDFVVRVPQDAAIKKFAASKNVMVRYHIQDIDLVFHTGFVGDPPVAGMGEPPGKPHLTLRMTSAVLDDVFMERISGMKAAMSGKMAFSGNTMRAMALQRVQKDLNRVYRAAREELGPPPEASVAGPSAVSHRPLAAAAQFQPTAPSAKDQQPTATGDERDEMMLIIDDLFAAHLLTSTGGNVSIRRPDHPDEFWITPSALPKGHLNAGMLVRIDIEGEPLDEGTLAPSSERLLHTAIYRTRPEIEAVVHSHGPRAFALGLSGLPFLPVSTESAFIGELPRVPFIMPGTEELAEATAAAMADASAALLVNHGAVSAARSLRRAADITAVIEQTAGALMECHAAGTPPPVLPREIVAQLREIGEMMG